ncbi:MAG TPA: hypothetical protein DCW29_25350 [Janthinobacterium sp.]|nr:hypothetical protein [Janthinobacterium sp.]
MMSNKSRPLEYFGTLVSQYLSKAIKSCSAIVIPLLAGVLSLAPLPAQASHAARADTVDHCSWDHPGVDPFMGDVGAAVDRYVDIPPAVREQLKQRMHLHKFDEIVTISRDAISGKHHYDARISEMHFGAGRVCRTVSRSAWSAQKEERGLVYCEESYCILVPTICRNVSRVTRTPGGAGGAGGGEADPARAEQSPATLAETASGLAETAPSPFDAPRDGTSGHGFMEGGAPSTEAPIFRGLLQSASNPPSFSSGGGAVYAAARNVSGTFASTSTSEAFLPVTAVPEPETGSMMLAGLTFLALAVRRKRPAKTSAAASA